MEIAVGPYLYALPQELCIHIFSYVCYPSDIDIMASINLVFQGILANSVQTLSPSPPRKWKDIKFLRCLRETRCQIHVENEKEIEDICSRRWICLRVYLNGIKADKLYGEDYEKIMRFFDLLSRRNIPDEVCSLTDLELQIYSATPIILIVIRDSTIMRLSNYAKCPNYAMYGKYWSSREINERVCNMARAISYLPFNAIRVTGSTIHVFKEAINTGKIKKLVILFDESNLYDEDVIYWMINQFHNNKFLEELEFHYLGGEKNITGIKALIISDQAVNPQVFTRENFYPRFGSILEKAARQQFLI